MSRSRWSAVLKTRRLTTDTEHRSLVACTHGPIEAYRCPVCGGRVDTRPARADRPHYFEFVCHPCGAHGMVHTRCRGAA